jgi:putative tricarboxylic transport membrane protein
VVPWLVTAMLAVLGVALIFETSGERDAAEEPRGALDHRPLMWVIAGLVINVTTITYLGFIIASTALFVCAARGFDSKSPLRDAAVGLAIAVVVYVGFDRGLGYEIGDGLIENLL